MNAFELYEILNATGRARIAIGIMFLLLDKYDEDKDSSLCSDDLAEGLETYVSNISLTTNLLVESDVLERFYRRRGHEDEIMLTRGGGSKAYYQLSRGTLRILGR